MPSRSGAGAGDRVFGFFETAPRDALEDARLAGALYTRTLMREQLFSY